MTTYTAPQAAAVTGLSVKVVQKAIDSKSIPYRIVRRRGRTKRYLLDTSLLCLRLQADGLKELPVGIRKKIFRAVAASPREPLLRFAEVICVDIRKARHGLAVELNKLRKAERMVVSNPEIMTGAQIIRGTRIPVYTIAEMRLAGTPVEEILQGYPSISKDQVRLAEIYASAHPKRGRPVAQPWTGGSPKRALRKKLRGVA